LWYVHYQNHLETFDTTKNIVSFKPPMKIWLFF
jgi:hypothetical protein